MSGDAFIGLMVFCGFVFLFWRVIKVQIIDKLWPGGTGIPKTLYRGLEASTARSRGTLDVWFETVVRDAVHLLIVGETGSGKSTVARAILTERARRGEHIVILDPHARPSTWAGLEAIGGGRNYPAIEAALKELQRELDTRFAQYSADDTYSPTRLNIIVDEIPSIAVKCPSWQEFFTTLSCEARKVNMSLICLTQSRLVDMLGIKGRGDVRENFTELLLGDKAIKAVPEAAQDQYPAVLDHRGSIQRVSTTQLPQLSNRVIEHNVLWQVPVPENTPILADFQPDTNTDTDTTPDTNAELVKAIRQAHQKGVSKNTIVSLMRMNRNKALKLIDEVVRAGE